MYRISPWKFQCWFPFQIGALLFLSRPILIDECASEVRKFRKILWTVWWIAVSIKYLFSRLRNTISKGLHSSSYFNILGAFRNSFFFWRFCIQLKLVGLVKFYWMFQLLFNHNLADMVHSFTVFNFMSSTHRKVRDLVTRDRMVSIM